MTFRLYDKTDEKAELVIFDCFDVRIQKTYDNCILIHISYNFNDGILTDKRTYDYDYYKRFVETRIE